MYLSCSTGLAAEKFQALLDEPSVDVWKVDAERRVDIRMSWKLYESLGWKECSVLHDSVEELVANFEKQMLNKTDADWFEEYVSTKVAGFQTLHNDKVDIHSHMRQQMSAQLHRINHIPCLVYSIAMKTL